MGDDDADAVRRPEAADDAPGGADRYSPVVSVVNHVGQCTTDLDRATAFYVELLGFVVERELVVPPRAAGPLLGLDPPIGLRAVYLSLEGFTLELLAFDGDDNPRWAARVMNDPGLTHLSISVDDFDLVLSRVESLGGQIFTRLPNAAMVRDPDGQLVEILPMSYREQFLPKVAGRPNNT